MNKKPDDPTLKLPALAGRLVVPMMAGGALLLVLGVALGAFTEAGMSFAMGAYLTAFTYCLTIALGALFFVLIQFSDLSLDLGTKHHHFIVMF